METHKELNIEFREFEKRVEDRYRKLSSSKVNFLLEWLKGDEVEIPEGSTNQELLELFNETGNGIWEMPEVLVYGRHDIETYYVIEVEGENMLLASDEYGIIGSFQFDQIAYFECKLNLVGELEIYSPVAKLEKFIDKI